MAAPNLDRSDLASDQEISRYVSYLSTTTEGANYLRNITAAGQEVYPELAGPDAWRSAVSAVCPTFPPNSSGHRLTYMGSYLYRLKQMCSCFALLLEESKPDGGMTFERVQEITKDLPRLGDVKVRGAQGIYMILNEETQTIEIGQSGDMQAMAQDLARTDYKDWQQLVLVHIDTHTSFLDLANLKIALDVSMRMKPPARLTHTHQPLWGPKDDVEERALIKQEHISVAYLLLYVAHGKAARGEGPNVPPLTSRQDKAKMALLLDILDPLIRNCQELQGDPGVIIDLFGEAEAPLRRQMARTLTRFLPWDMAGAE